MNASRKPFGRPPARSTVGIVPLLLLGVILGSASLASAGPLDGAVRAVSSPGAPSTGPLPSGSGCAVGSDPACVVAYAGSGWRIQPVSSWCSFNSTLEPGTNGSGPQNSTIATCTPSAAFLSFNMTGVGFLGGTLTADGPFRAWVVPSGTECGVMGEIARIPWPCPPPYGTFPSYTWNATVPSAGTLDLSDLAAGPGPIPGSHWDLMVVDTGAVPENLTASSTITLTVS